jgi:hypothetical protein
MQIEDFNPLDQLTIYSGSQTGAFPARKTSLFRYVSMRGDHAWSLLEKTVLQNIIPLITSENLNDPFDGNPIIVNDITFDDFAAFQDAAPVDKDGKPFLSIRTTVTRPDGTIATEAEKEAIAARIVMESFVERNRGTKIASFCRRISSQLLWSHYANAYKGLAYHFTTSGNAKSVLVRVRPVRYERQRPIILISEMLDILASPSHNHLFQRNMSFERRAYLTKSIEWSYEEEERLISHDESDAAFESDELTAIIVGPRFSEDDLVKLKSVVAKRSRPLKIFRARVSESDYAIEVEWSNPIAA